MQIVQYGHPVLRWMSKPIQSINAELRSTVREMFDLMYSAKGIGLAANQVGLPFRFFVVNVTADPEQQDEEFVFINPRIRRRKGAMTGEEGCLSLPGLYANIERAEEIVVEAYDLDAMTQAQLAQTMGIDARQVRRLLDLGHESRLSQLEAALAALGLRVEVSVSSISYGASSAVA